jgi:cyclase
MIDLLKHFRILEPHPNVLAFYDGRVDGHRFAEHKNWVDDGALSVGIASYAIISGKSALVYDPHVTVQHATAIRRELEDRGVKDFNVVLSHWHLDHVAGTEAFADCSIIANRKTFEHLRKHKAAIENGTQNGLPAINPLVLPDTLFEGRKTIRIGAIDLELIEANIHSDDATIVWWPDRSIMLAGDTMEDTVTYVCEPENFDTHLSELDRLAKLDPAFILPNHGDPDIISVGGYDKGLIKAQQQYIRMLKRCRTEEALRVTPLEQIIAGPLQMGWVNMYEPYRGVHAENLALVLALKDKTHA